MLPLHSYAANWTAVKWLLWIGLYLILGFLAPWLMTRAWAHHHRSDLRPGFRQLFQNGELGLIGLILAISVIWDLQRSQYTPFTVTLGSVFLTVTAIMAGQIWIESYCRRSTNSDFQPERGWRDSRTMLLLVASQALVIEMLLDRFAKVTAQ